MMMPNLPEDLVEEILSRVPAITLKRLRSTCKRWNQLFTSDRQFTKEHFSKAAKHFMVLLLKDFRVYSISVNFHGIHNNVADPSIVVSSKMNLTDSHNNSDVDIYRVFHCDGLLLCAMVTNCELMVWNPCTGQTKRIEPRHVDGVQRGSYGFGYEKTTSRYSYKVLHSSIIYNSKPETVELGIYEFNSNSWRVFDAICHHRLLYSFGMSLKGNAYWIAIDTNNSYILLSFSFTTEKFERLSLPFDPFEYSDINIIALSSTREEKHLAFMQCSNIFEIRIWVTNKIEPNVVPWSKFFTVPMRAELILRGGFSTAMSFFIDEERKVAVCYDRHNLISTYIVYIIGEDEYREEDLGNREHYSSCLCNYVPSLVQS